MEPGSLDGTFLNPAQEALRLQLLALDATIAGLEPLAAADPDIATVLTAKRQERALVHGRIDGLQPQCVDFLMAVQARDRALERQAKLAEEEAGLGVLLAARQTELKQVTEEVSKWQARTKELSTEQRLRNALAVQEAVSTATALAGPCLDLEQGKAPEREESEEDERETWLRRLDRTHSNLTVDSALSELPGHLAADRSFILAAVSRNGRVLSRAAEPFRSDREIVLSAVRNNGQALAYADQSLKADRQVVRVAVQEGALSLDSAREPMPTSVKSKPILKASLATPPGSALRFADDKLKADRELVLAAVCEDGNSLEHASDQLRADKNLVLNALQTSPAALQYAEGHLDHDPDCMVAAGLLQDDAAPIIRYPRSEKAVLSVKFSEHPEQSTPYATAFLHAMKQDPFLGQFQVYNPNDGGKKSGESDFTTFDDPCKGMLGGSLFPEADSSWSAAEARPCPTICWRFAFRGHQKECKASNGFMVQVEEKSGLGAGQRIEIQMAEQIRLKVFRTYTNLPWFSQDGGAFQSVSRAVKAWYERGGTDVEMEHIFIGSSGMAYEKR